MDFGKNFVLGRQRLPIRSKAELTRTEKDLIFFDTFCQIPGRIDNNDNGDIACDHYHRWKDDIAVMKEIGLKAYRFSLNWAKNSSGGYRKSQSKRN